ncbi:MAG TPA: SDR family oxidoreductase [Kiloniellales bacterium]|nr:SDR family oxidoreductase [Kiloniellales bacterium]
MKMSGNTIAITGGGSGIGRQLALRFSEFGNRIIVAGRRKESLEETIAGRPNMHALVLDVDDPESIESFVTRLVTEHPALNVLINNAGIMRQERLTGRWDLRDSEQTILTNLLGPIRLTNALVDHLAVQPDAAIVNVTSGLAFVPLPVTPTYSATKAALHSFTLSLREQLKGRVEVIELAPPAVQTELTPGQSTRPGFQPLEEFVDEVMARFAERPTAEEILVDRVRFLRWAERDGRFDEALQALAAT